MTFIRKRGTLQNVKVYQECKDNLWKQVLRTRRISKLITLKVELIK